MKDRMTEEKKALEKYQEKINQQHKGFVTLQRFNKME